MQTNLGVAIGKLRMDNPVTIASGTFGYAEEFADLVDLKKLGAIVTKTITLKPRQGNLPPRTCETPAGMLNSIGLENPGLDVFLKEKLPALARIGPPIIVSISAVDNPEEFVALARALDSVKSVAAIELNISCPNVRHAHASGKLIAQDPRATYAAVSSVHHVTQKPIITKLSPNVSDIVEIAQAAQNAGSDAVALINTLTGMSIDIKSRRPKLACGSGGLSGPAIRPVAVRMVWEVYSKIKIPILGMGGIIDTESALEFLISGAQAVCVGTANFINPKATIEIIDGIKKYLRENKIKSVNQIIGSLKP